MVNGEMFRVWYRVEYHSKHSEEANADGWVVCAPDRIRSLEEAQRMIENARRYGSKSRHRIVKTEQHESVLDFNG